MAATGEYYRTLGLAADATQDDIKKAFRKLARACHPDVAGDDPESAENFGRIREAYEALADPERRAKYDRRQQRMSDREGGAHIRSEWRPPGGWDGFSGHSKVRAARRSAHQKSDITLDDIFTQPSGGRADFGFGTQKPDRDSAESDALSEIGLNIEVLGRTARLGGTVTVRYKRRRRSSDGVNVYSYDEIHDLRVPPRTCTGDVLRSERMGHFSTTTNRYGDLVSKLTVLEESGRHHPRRDARPPDPDAGAHPPPGKAMGGTGHSDSVRISLVEAVLGGRVGVETPKGPVHVSIPPGTSSGKVLRLKGKGEAGDDWHVRIEIAVPEGLDDESRALISRFGALNPMDVSKS